MSEFVNQVNIITRYAHISAKFYLKIIIKKVLKEALSKLFSTWKVLLLTCWNVQVSFDNRLEFQPDVLFDRSLSSDEVDNLDYWQNIKYTYILLLYF